MPRPRLEGYWMRVQGPAHRPWMQSFISLLEWTHRLKVQLYQQIETCHPESQDCTLNREMKETKLKAQSMSNHNLTQWMSTRLMRRGTRSTFPCRACFSQHHSSEFGSTTQWIRGME